MARCWNKSAGLESKNLHSRRSGTFIEQHRVSHTPLLDAHLLTSLFILFSISLFIGCARLRGCQWRPRLDDPFLTAPWTTNPMAKRQTIRHQTRLGAVERGPDLECRVPRIKPCKVDQCSCLTYQGAASSARKHRALLGVALSHLHNVMQGIRRSKSRRPSPAPKGGSGLPFFSSMDGSSTWLSNQRSSGRGIS